MKTIKVTEVLSLYSQNEWTLRCQLPLKKDIWESFYRITLKSDIIMAAIGITISKRKKGFFYPRDLTAQIIHDLAKFENQTLLTFLNNSTTGNFVDHNYPFNLSTSILRKIFTVQKLIPLHTPSNFLHIQYSQKSQGKSIFWHNLANQKDNFSQNVQFYQVYRFH